VNKKWNIDKVRNFIEVESNSGCKLISDIYLEIKSPLKIECKCGNKFTTSFDTFLRSNKRQCNICGRLKTSEKLSLSFEEVKYFIDIESKSNCKLEQDFYIDAITKMKIKCSCGEIFYTSLNKFKNGKIQCNICGRKLIADHKRLKLNEMIEYINNNSNYTFVSIDNKNNITSKSIITLKCDKGHEYKTEWNNFQQGKRCPYCLGKYKTTSDFYNEVNIITNGEYTLVGEYIDSSTYTKIIHNICGHIWDITPNNFLNGHRCPKCKLSKGECLVKGFLENNFIQYIFQYKFIECKNKFSLPFDFAVINNDKLLCLIEYDGKQHFEPVNFGGISDIEAYKNYLNTVYNDNIKNLYCKSNNIKLIRIPYWEFNNIENILEKELRNIINLKEVG